MSHLSGIPESPLVPLMARSSRERRGDPQTNIEGGVDRTGGSPESNSAGSGASDAGSSASGSGSGSSISGDISDLRARMDAAEGAISDLQDALSGASIAASCNDDGTITVTLTLGGS